MKIRSFTIRQATKFNDPHEKYRNHSVGVDLNIELEEGEDLDAALEEGRKSARLKTDQERSALIARCELQHQYQEATKNTRDAMRSVERYEKDTASGIKAREHFDKLMLDLRSRAEDLAARGVFVEVPLLAISVSGVESDEY